MRIQRTSQMITASVIFFSLLTVVSAIISLRYRTLQEANYAARRVASGALRQLAMGSDRLTTAVRAYAATGDRRDYDEFFRELNVDRTRDIAVQQLMQIELTSHERSLLTQAKQNSDGLVGLEYRALEAAAKKDHAVALALVYGDEYRTGKASIMQPIDECTRSLDVRFTGQAETLSHQSRVAGYVALAATVANGAAILAALLLFYGRRVVNPLASLNQSLRDLLARKAGVSIGHQQDSSEIGELARSMETYRRTVEEAERQRWVKTNVAEVGEGLQQAERPEDFGQKLLSALVPRVGGGYGAIHLLDEATGRYQLVSGYGIEERRRGGTSFAPGDGVAGQAAVERKVIVLTDIPPDYVR